MNPKERVLAAINHQRVDRFPTDIWAVQEVWENLYQYFRVETRLEVYDQLGIDGIIHAAPKYIGPSLLVQDDYYEDEWGMGYQKQEYPTGVYFEQTLYPLSDAETIDDLDAYAWPSPDWYDYHSIALEAGKYPDRAIECGYSAIFYYHNKLRGLEASLMDPLLRPEFTKHLLKRLSDFFYEYHYRCFEAAQPLIDLTQVTDDFGSQTNLLISPRTFDEFYREPMQRAINLAKEYDIKVFHHDDGDIRKLLPRFVEMGVDVLNPVQWRCGNWDLDGVKNEFGPNFCFHGGVDNQHTLPFGSADDVVREVRWLKSTLGKDGTGLIVAPCHNIQANTPIENILALYETVVK